MLQFIKNVLNAQRNARLVYLLGKSQENILAQNKQLKQLLKEKQEEVYDYAYGENELIKKIAKLEGRPYLTKTQAQAHNDAVFAKLSK